MMKNYQYMLLNSFVFFFFFQKIKLNLQANAVLGVKQGRVPTTQW